MTDWTVAEICVSVGLRSVGSFTTSFKRDLRHDADRLTGHQPPAALPATRDPELRPAHLPAAPDSTFEEDNGATRV